MLMLLRLPAGWKQLNLLAYEAPAYLYEESTTSLYWVTRLEMMLGSYLLVQFLLGTITIAGVLFLLDRRTRRLGLAIALPPIIMDSFVGFTFPHWTVQVISILLPAWVIWAILRPTVAGATPERNFYPTPSLENYERFYPLIVPSVVIAIVVLSSIARRPPSDGARALVGHRMVNHRGAWTYQPSQSQSESIPNQPFDIYFTPYGVCRASLNGVNIDGRLLHEEYRRNIHLDCLPNNTRLYAEFKIEGDTLIIHNHKNDPPFRLQFVKKNWGPGWYSDFLPGFLTK